MKLQGVTIGLMSLAAAGAFTFIQAQEEAPPPPMRHPGHEWSTQHRLDRLSQELNLTPNQKSQVQTVFEQMRTNIMTAVEQARTNANTQLQQILTPEQYQQFQEIRQRHEQRWHHHMTNETDNATPENNTP